MKKADKLLGYQIACSQGGRGGCEEEEEEQKEVKKGRTNDVLSERSLDESGRYKFGSQPGVPRLVPLVQQMAALANADTLQKEMLLG